MSETEVGQEVWVRGYVAAKPLGDGEPVKLRFSLYDSPLSDWIPMDQIIPVSPPLDAPDGPGMWANCIDGVWTAYQIVMHNPGGKLGFSDGDYWITIFKGPWHRIPDGMFGAEKVEAALSYAEKFSMAADIPQRINVVGEAVDELHGEIADLKHAIEWLTGRIAVLEPED